MPTIDEEKAEFIQQLKRRQIVGSRKIASRTVTLLRKVIERAKWKSAAELMAKIRTFARGLATMDFVAIENVVRHVLWIIREEFKELDAQQSVDSPASKPREGTGIKSLQDLTSSTAPSTPDFTKQHAGLKPSIMEAIAEFADEIDEIYDNIGKQAEQHIHANEVVLTLGNSTTVEQFLLAAAAKGRPIEVIVCEAAPAFSGHEFAVSLAKKGCKTTLVSDAAIFAIMARVNKVIIGAHAVMANGGVITHAGCQAVALAAKMHSVPVVVCTGLYKLSPLYPSDLDRLIKLENPSSILPFDADSGDVQLYNPVFDYLEPELVSLFVTNQGGHSPSYVYRLIVEYYALEDESLRET